MFDSEALAPDAEWIPPSEASAGVRSVYRGREEFAEFMRTWTEDFEDYSVWLEEMIDAGGDRVVGRFTTEQPEKGVEYRWSCTWLWSTRCKRDA
jgi:hypothetical protein